jgi:hypothetical protein
MGEPLLLYFRVKIGGSDRGDFGLFCAGGARGGLAGEYWRGVEWEESLVCCVCSP